MKKLLNRLYQLIGRLYDKKVDATGLAIFRFFFSLNLIAEVITLYNLRQLVFGAIPYAETTISIGTGLILWIIVLCFLAIGLFTRPAAILNYILTLLFISTAHEFEYHMFYVYSGINCLLIFLQSGQVLSIDRLLKKIKYSTIRNTYHPPTTVSVLNYFVPLLFGIAFVYFDSVFYKVSSQNWRNGIGMWLPSSLSFVSISNNQWLLNQKYLMYFLGYFTIVFEAAYILFFWSKRWRIPLMIVGVGLHIAIYFEYPIPWFGLGVTAIYLLMVPVHWWTKMFDILRRKKPVVRFYYDAECPLCKRTVLVLSHLDVTNSIEYLQVQQHYQADDQLKNFPLEELLSDIFSVDKGGKISKGVDTYRKVFFAVPYLIPLGILLSIPGISHLAKFVYHFVSRDRIVERCTEENCHIPQLLPPPDWDNMKITKRLSVRKLKVAGITSGLLICLVLQVNSTLLSPPFRILKEKFIYPRVSFAGRIDDGLKDVMHFSKYAFGITPHPVFMDTHFNNYSRITAIVRVKDDGSEDWLPIITKEGRPGRYLCGFTWVNWTFRVNVKNPYSMQFENGIKKYTGFYLYDNLLSTGHADFKIMVKMIRPTKKWEKDYLKEQLETPWVEAGTATWRNGVFDLDFPNRDKFPFGKELSLKKTTE